jgi:hypothetical protein
MDGPLNANVRVDRLERYLERIIEIEERNTKLLERILKQEFPTEFPTGITFQRSNNMEPTEGGSTQIFTGTLAPAGATYPPSTTFAVTSNDPAVTPTVDSTGLIVTIPYPTGWVENPTTPFAVGYSATGPVSGESITATITPSAPPATFPTGISFAQTQ